MFAEARAGARERFAAAGPRPRGRRAAGNAGCDHIRLARGRDLICSLDLKSRRWSALGALRVRAITRFDPVHPHERALGV
eukprot:7073138-Prymnesium_polylepis.1